MTTIEALKGISSYPIPMRTLDEVMQRNGVDAEAETTIEVLQSKGYKLAYADLLMWLSYSPSISQGGQSYSFTEEQRVQFRARANEIFGEYADEDNTPKVRFGYKGSRL